MLTEDKLVDKWCSCCKTRSEKNKNHKVQKLVALEATDKHGEPYYLCPDCDAGEKLS